MHDLDVLRDLAIITGLAIPIVALAHRVRLPPLVAFLLTGVLIGPSGAGLIPDPEAVSALSEIGVVLLLFAIGLEFSLSVVLRWGRSVLVAGGAQAGGMIALVAGAGAALGVPLGRALFYGFLAAMSSTAVVTRAYSDRGELDTPPGRESVSILLFQDLCVVPFMLLAPLLAGREEAAGTDLWLRVLGGLAVVGALVVGGRAVVRWTLDRVVLVRDRELFTLSIGFFAVATALVTAGVGFSLAIGAFLAGLIISDSEYGLQALSDVLPFRALFSGVFFTSIGMLLDVPLVLGQPLLVIGAALALIAVKALVTTGAVVLRGRSLDVGLTTGLSLAQVGEFSFVLAAAGLPLGLFADGHYQLFLSVAALSMMATPFLVATARPIADALVRRLPGRRRAVADGPAPADAAHGHAVIVGYGVAGRYLTRMLRAAGITVVVVDQNLELVRQARADGVLAVFGDGTRHAVLESVAAARSRIIVYAVSSPVDERRGAAVAHEVAPTARIVVRTRYVRSIDDLMRKGATDVVVEEFEASLELFARALRSYELPAARIARELDAVRREHYGLLRGTAAPDLKLDTLKHLGIHEALELVEVEQGAAAVGGSARTLDLRRRTNAIQVAVVRDGVPIYRRDQTFRYQVGDTAVLVGDREALDTAALLFRGPAPPAP
ncbi:MAG: cation:proton antiporter [Acidobacteria bacterium]|nr:cation:proton antiporter [Acidobacteriota bacterium]